MAALQAGGVEQTALHNHLLDESPHVMYMHIMAARRSGEDRAPRSTRALAQSKTPLGAPAAPAPARGRSGHRGAIAKALGVSGQAEWRRLSGQRAARARRSWRWARRSAVDGRGTAINFQPTGGGKAAITGDFVLRGSEVNPVIRALRERHRGHRAAQSLLDEEPRLFFMHFWANDDAVKLARGLRAALDQTKSKP